MLTRSGRSDDLGVSGSMAARGAGSVHSPGSMATREASSVNASRSRTVRRAGWVDIAQAATVRRAGAFVFGLAVAMRLPVLVAAWNDHSMFIGGDTGQYLALADRPDGYWSSSSPSWDLSFARPPGYAVLLAPVRWVSSSLFAAGLFQVLVGALAAWLTYRVALSFLGSGPAAVAGTWVAIDPATVVQSTRLLSEMPFAVAFLIWAACAGRAVRERSPGWAAASGAALAAATFIRPITLYLPLLLAPGLVLAVGRRMLADRTRADRTRAGRTRAVAVGLAFACAFALPVGAWIARNHVAGDVGAFSTIEGTNMLDYRAVAAISEQEGISLQQARSVTRDALERATGPGLDGPALDHAKARVGRELLLEHPRGYVVQASKGLGRTLFGTQRSETAQFLDAVPGGTSSEKAATAAALGSAVLLLAGSTFGAVTALRRRDEVVLVALVVPVVYMLAVGSGLESDARFRMPLVPAMALLAVYGVARRRSRSGAPDPTHDLVIDLRDHHPVRAAPDGSRRTGALGPDAGRDHDADDGVDRRRDGDVPVGAGRP